VEACAFASPWGVVQLAPSDDQLTVLRYVRDHEPASAAAVALELLNSPRTTFGRPVHLRQAERELADLFAQGLIYRVGDGRRAAFALTIVGRQLLRGADSTRSVRS
jgi:hypothetical protein